MLKPAMEKMTEMEKAMITMVDKEQQYQNDHDARLVKASVEMCCGFFSRMLADHHAHRLSSNDEHQAKWKPILEFMQKYQGDDEPAALLPEFQYEKDETAAKKKEIVEVAEKKEKVLDDCDHWVNICKTLKLTGE